MPTTFHAHAFRSLATEAGDISLKQISERTNLTKGHLSRLLRGLTQPNLATAKRLADAYDTDLDDLVTRDAA